MRKCCELFTGSESGGYPGLLLDIWERVSRRCSDHSNNDGTSDFVRVIPIVCGSALGSIAAANPSGFLEIMCLVQQGDESASAAGAIEVRVVSSSQDAADSCGGSSFSLCSSCLSRIVAHAPDIRGSNQDFLGSGGISSVVFRTDLSSPVPPLPPVPSVPSVPPVASCSTYGLSLLSAMLDGGGSDTAVLSIALDDSSDDEFLPLLSSPDSVDSVESAAAAAPDVETEGSDSTGFMPLLNANSDAEYHELDSGEPLFLEVPLLIDSDDEYCHVSGSPTEVSSSGRCQSSVLCMVVLLIVCLLIIALLFVMAYFLISDIGVALLQGK